ncbi:hypothetical protein [Polluticoccus soli]|uniref:hypothetical protein n=1 Tax=Polluticoccus soli TaxID=3034150 RepID=UPI0023E2F8A9|nr:hypothetical protein [Flavipsychrobacter sp. JY13-12]
MHSFHLLTAVTLLMIVASCSKDPLTPKPTYPAPGTWQVDDTAFRARQSKWYRNYDSLDVIVFSIDTLTETSVNIQFFKRPTGTDTFKLVNQPDSENEAAIDEWQQNAGHSGTRDELGGTLYVTEQNGKLTFKASNVELRHYTFVVDYNVTCSLNLTEF